MVLPSPTMVCLYGLVYSHLNRPGRRIWNVPLVVWVFFLLLTVWLKLPLMPSESLLNFLSASTAPACASPTVMLRPAAARNFSRVFCFMFRPSFRLDVVDSRQADGASVLPDSLSAT